MKDKELTKEQREALDKFKQQFPGLWERILELFGEFRPDGV